MGIKFKMISLNSNLKLTEQVFKSYFKDFEVIDMKSSGVSIDVKTSEVLTRDIRCSSDINVQLPKKNA
jgi:hypothetical protein